MVRLTDFSDQPSAPPQFYLNQQQQQNAIPLAAPPVQPVSIVMNTQSAVPPSLPQPRPIEQTFPAPVQPMQSSVSVPVSVPQKQTEQSSPEWQKTSAADTPTASVFQTEQQQQQQVEERVGRIEYLKKKCDGIWKWNKNLTGNNSQNLI